MIERTNRAEFFCNVKQNSRNKCGIVLIPEDICNKIGINDQDKVKIRCIIEFVGGDVNGSKSFR